MNPFDIQTYDFDLPPGHIAQYPKSPRDHARLLVVERSNNSLKDHVFFEITDYLGNNDVLVLNETKVMAARLHGVKEKTGAAVEILLLRPQGDSWSCLARPAKRLKPGTIIMFGGDKLRGEVLAELDFAGGKLIKFDRYQDWEETIRMVGEIPLPPYISRPALAGDEHDYQTVYARETGSVAAPTAGLHFTPKLLDQIERNGTEIVRLTLHVGLGTFRPVEAADIRNHTMHSEVYELKSEEAAKLNRARRAGKRIVAVGTTSVRSLETAFVAGEGFVPQMGETGIFIFPGYQFKGVDALITNFHLPKSSLLMLVYAFGGISLMRQAYEHAVAGDYRFYSYGDAVMVI
ncbi:MAG: tRNA preQ1(34) S-adenosylmethionine ribosyltransferase-isomerase QueA [Syntrophomonadaceae bacterium]|nr:tRNA preQ1(34) S-adenosylmethionine ribosyltransferase-isomerase QueA [Syntrophomonadaceae bacterium]